MRCVNLLGVGSAEVSPRRGLPTRIEAEQFPLFAPVDDLFEDDLTTFLPPTATPVLLVASVFLVLHLHSLRFRTFNPFEWPENFSALCMHHGVYRNYWKELFS